MRRLFSTRPFDLFVQTKHIGKDLFSSIRNERKPSADATSEKSLADEYEERSKIYEARDLYHKSSWNHPQSKRFGINTDIDFSAQYSNKEAHEEHSRIE